MNTLVFIAFAATFVISSSTSIFNDGSTFFKHREKPVERRASPMSGRLPNYQDLTARWIKRFYHNRNVDEPSESIMKYRFVLPENVKWLMERLEDNDPNFNSLPAVQDSANALQSEDDGQPQSFPDDSGSDALDYGDIMDVGSSVNNNHSPMEPTFQQALTNYLMSPKSQVKPEAKTGRNEDGEGPSKFASVSKTADTSTTGSLADVSPTPDSVPKTTSTASPTLPSSSLSAVPPVHSGKGQKEYAMLRPASENSRKFDNWAATFQKSLLASSISNKQPVIQGFDSDMFDADRLAEQLDKLKVRRNKRGVKVARMAFY